MTIKIEKMTTPKSPKAWPNGTVCSRCGRRVCPGDSVAAGYNPMQGSVAWHRNCLIKLAKECWPEAWFDEIKESIMQDPEQAIFTRG